MDTGKTLGAILAGGQSSRMGGHSKALVQLDGRPLLAHVIERLRPQVIGLVLSGEPGDGGIAAFGLPLVPDLVPGHRGPLAGLYSALRHMADAGCSGSLLLCPCDAPFVPPDLAQILLEASTGGRVAVAAWRGELQPTFSLWQTRHLGTIRKSLLEDGLGGPRQVLDHVPHEVVEWPDAEPPPFFNVNTPADLARAQAWLDPSGR